MHTAFFIKLFNKELTEMIHQKTRSHHTTPTNLTKREDHVNRALCTENNEIPPPASNRELSHTPRRPLGETRVRIRSSRLLASTLCTRYSSCHHLRSTEQSSRLRSASSSSVLPMTPPRRQTAPPPCALPPSRDLRRGPAAPCRRDSSWMMR